MLSVETLADLGAVLTEQGRRQVLGVAHYQFGKVVETRATLFANFSRNIGHSVCGVRLNWPVKSSRD
jgi:hypothetical protein